MKRFLSILLSSCFLLSAAPIAYATENVRNVEITADTSIYEELPSDDRLFSGYVDQVFYGGITTFGTGAREYLNSAEQQIYDKLKAVIVDVAANGGNTEITIKAADITGLTCSWPTGADVMAEFEKQVNVQRIWTALVHDCPYDLYWLDKNQNGMSMGMSTVDDGTNVSVDKLNFIFFVSLNYQPAFNQKTTVKSDVAVVKTAVKNAQKIVDKYAHLDDYSKLVAYKNEICSLVKYDSSAIEGGVDYVDNSSWQMINVFDGLAATNAVSDGYTKAFQYLCDMSQFDNARCYTIKGTIDYVDFMWNIVTMEDGKTYLLDVTNSDTGRPGEYGQFFLAGYDDGGRWSGFVVNGNRYAYHSSTIFDINMLILADKDYFYIPQGTAHYGQCGDNVYWLLSEDGTLTIRGWGDMWSEYSTSDTASYLPPWHEYRKDVKNIVIEPGVTFISDYRFYLCQYAETATIPDTVTAIGEMAFYSCMALKELTVPDSVISLETAAFGNCSSLEKIKLPRKITRIPSWLLNSAAITEIVIPDGVTSIGDNAFYGCNNLKYVTMPAAVKAVGASTFNTYPDDVIREVFFKGSDKQWNSIAFDEYNDILQAYIHYNYDESTTFNLTVGKSENGKVSLSSRTAKTGETVTVTATPDYGYRLKNILVDGKPIEGNTFAVACSHIVTAEFAVADGTPMPDRGVIRLSGKTRYQTSYKIADATKQKLGVDKFDFIIIASGTNFADALAGSYLAKVKSAPILMASGSNNEDLKKYMKSNLADGGTIYILGGTAAVPQSTEDALSAYNVKRIKGKTRFETNIEILKEAGVSKEEILVSTGYNFADSLSASAVGRPIILVDNNKGQLSDIQKEYLDSLETDKFYIIGGTAAVSDKMAAEIAAYGETERVKGATRYETSVEVAKKFFDNPNSAVLAYAQNFPDGLCGGPLAMSMNAPLILTQTGNSAAAQTYTQANSIATGMVLGGNILIDDATAKTIFSADKITAW